ncbi:hypothetical protein D923_02219 [Enterococcus faecalis 06-MB-S-04]|nr:hypothetical protein D923_02219 [Enterococcus faecalis 06-MB-S-04]
MLFRMVPKLRKDVTEQTARFRVMLFRMVPKLDLTSIMTG